jgi:histidinol-phosphatase (PHP family)
MFDSHMHTKFSTDSKMHIEEAISKAKELNLGIVITEHIDLNYPVPGSFVFNPKEYFNEYSKYRSNRVLLGVEIGMTNSLIDENKNIAIDHPFDYVIGSVHAVEDQDIFFEDFYKGRTKRDTYEHYFKYMADCLNTHTFIDCLGHIDYISRYARYDDKEAYYEDYSDFIDEVLKAAISNNKALEINTRRLTEASAVENLIKIYKRYYELGGRNVTTGSDAHGVTAVGSNLSKAKEIADLCNLKLVYFKNRKPEFI